MIFRRYMKAITSSIFKPERWINYSKYLLQASRRSGKVGYLPYVLDIEPTTVCNFRCRICQASDVGFAGDHMDLELFRKIINENPQLVKIKLQGMGEPFACPHLFEMMVYARQKKVMVELTTNGSFLNGENITSILDAKISRLTVSIDGAEAHTFEKIREGANFEQIKRGALKMAQSVQGERGIRFSAWTVLQKDNLHELEKIVVLCKEIGFSDLTIQTHLTIWGKERWEKKNQRCSIIFNDERQLEIIRRALMVGKRLGLPIQLPKNNVFDSLNPCHWPWHSVFVDCKGELIPCCLIADSTVKSFGSLADRSLKEIWNSKDYQEFRHKIKSNDIPAYCRNCYREYNNQGINLIFPRPV